MTRTTKDEARKIQDRFNIELSEREKNWLAKITAKTQRQIRKKHGGLL